MNLLIVDDDILILQDLKEMLNWASLTFDKLYTAGNTASALQMLHQVPIHLIICDIEMPGGIGLDFLESVQETHPEIPCILLTSYARFEYAQRAIRLHITDYLLKPVTSETLEASVRKALEQMRLSDQYKTAEKYSQYWLNESRNMAESFWSKSVHGQTAEIRLLSSKLGYDEEQLFTPVLLECFQNSKLDNWDSSMIEYTVKNIGYEALEDETLFPCAIISVTPLRWLAVIT